ncbi:MAG: DUF1552 domain-containing protein, partial [Alphaproteobacteria bacterium]
TWFWGCGMNPDRFTPERTGAGYDLPVELAPLAGLSDRVSVLSGFGVVLDGRPNLPHWTGVMSTLTGAVPRRDGDVDAPTLDTIVSKAIGSSTRFRSIEMSATGVPGQSYSREGASLVNAATVSPLELYTRIFGPGFADPGDASFRPDPRTLLRQSALSAVRDDATRLSNRLGSHDRRRLDQYLTSLRQLEQQIEVSLRPPDLAACRKPEAPAAEDVGSDLERATATHRLLADVGIAAMLCDQSRVFNMVFSWGTSELRKQGTDTAHHQLTHDEVVDKELGYQPRATEYSQASVAEWAWFVRRLAETPEGDGSLLDHCLVLGHSESSFAKSHSVAGLPVMLAGSAGGRVRPGLHVRGDGEPVTRVGLTVQRALGIAAEGFGTGSMRTERPLAELLA